MCLKVYFSQDYSDAEFIILNGALYCKQPVNHFLLIIKVPHSFECLSFGTNTRHHTVLFGQHNEQEENRSVCADNLTNSLARLPLYIKPSFDMTLALTIGVCISVILSRVLCLSDFGILTPNPGRFCDRVVQTLGGMHSDHSRISSLLLSGFSHPAEGC